jgi:hypothetical protein
MEDDLVEIAREMVKREVIKTHWQGCERDHPYCLIRKLADEVENLRERIWENENTLSNSKKENERTT